MVYMNPGAITGSSTLCLGACTPLYAPVGFSGGTWSTASSTVTVGSSTGVVCGTSVGTAVITYMMNTGCFGTFNMTVNPLPSAIYGPDSVCFGSSITLLD